VAPPSTIVTRAPEPARTLGWILAALVVAAILYLLAR
jgi:hypothetical protein